MQLQVAFRAAKCIIFLVSVVAHPIPSLGVPLLGGASHYTYTPTHPHTHTLTIAILDFPPFSLCQLGRHLCRPSWHGLTVINDGQAEIQPQGVKLSTKGKGCG